MEEYKISKLDKDQFQLLIPLMKDCFGMDVNVNYFDWKFNKNPSGFVEGFIALSKSNEIAAYYGVIPELFNVNGELKIIYQSCDTMTHSKHRRKGLFQKLSKTCFDYLKNQNKLYIYGFGGVDSTPGFLKFGWQHIFDVNYYFFPKILSLLQYGKDKSIVEILDISLVSDLFLKSNSQNKIHSIKNIDIFKWRISNPLHLYKTIAFKNEFNKFDSYLIYYFDEDKIVLFDFYYDEIESGKKIINYLKKILKNGNYKGIVTLSHEKSEYSLRLKSLGFLRNPFNMGPLSSKIPFIVYSHENISESFNNSCFWEINAFEHDSL